MGFSCRGNHKVLNPDGTENTSAIFIGNINPIRYRSYYYDTETGLYYLNARYYDPQIKRFINADEIGYLGANGDLNSYNLYAYCSNTPITKIDSNGHSAVATWLTGTGWIGAIDGPFPIGDIIVLGGAAILTIFGMFEAEKDNSSVTESVKPTYQELPRDHMVYGLMDPVTEKIEYVGRTKDREKRKKAHERDSKRSHLVMVDLATNLTAAEARGAEQILMLYHHTKNTFDKMNNQINGISPWNKLLNIYMEAGRGALQYYENKISNEYLYWTGN